MAEVRVKISVILPSFNAKAYIKECLESVCNQSLRDIEIICVDAGSTDGTIEILEEYEKKDARLTRIISDKKSYGYQMNLGIDAACGEYIGIVETDDWIPETMYEELYYIAHHNNAEFVKADFYRFREKEQGLVRMLYSQDKSHTYYGRLIDIEKEQECFRFPVNTWSGIYQRKYLKAYDIRHNETLGASFQDNGFWFQTFAYAKRAFFVDKPYYMNRRDNPESSVFNRNKIFCICDEFDFIRTVLKKRNDLFQKLKPAYSIACFLAYSGNLDRISAVSGKVFSRRFSEDFHKLQKQGILDLSMFRKEEKEMLLSVMDDPESFYEHSTAIEKKQALYKIRLYENVIIYGAGEAGRTIWKELVYHGITNIYCFAVSSKDGNPGTFQNMPVYGITELLDYREKSLVIIAISPKNPDSQSEIEDTLKKLGFMHILYFPGYQRKKNGL